jgi:hypothetical protein
MLKFSIIVLCIFSCSAALAEDDYSTAVQDWAVVLEKYVDSQGRTAFSELAIDRKELDTFVDYVSRVSPESTPDEFNTPEKILAYHINAYNALAMHGVVEEDIPEDFGNFFKRAGFFKFRKVIIGGRKTSLYDYENKVIRPLGEPRVHFALNCMVRDCPRLPQTPFIDVELEQQLQAVALEFFSKDIHLRIDNGNKEAFVSEILRFYTEDFVESNKRQDLIQYINRYRPEAIPTDYKVRFIPYNWTINSQP